MKLLSKRHPSKSRTKIINAVPRMLSMDEFDDSVVIYNVPRREAPRVFYVDVGEAPPALKESMKRYLESHVERIKEHLDTFQAKGETLPSPPEEFKLTCTYFSPEELSAAPCAEDFAKYSAPLDFPIVQEAMNELKETLMKMSKIYPME